MSAKIHAIPMRARRARRATKEERQFKKLARRTTIATAGIIPAAALAATVQAGSLIGTLAFWPVAIVATCLYLVSVPHVAKGLAITTGLERSQAWLVALAIDGMVIAGEVAALSDGVVWLAAVMMATGVASSSVYNAVGFLQQRD